MYVKELQGKYSMEQVIDQVEFTIKVFYGVTKDSKGNYDQLSYNRDFEKVDITDRYIFKDQFEARYGFNDYKHEINL
jgi:hypothetical protein